MVTEGDRRDAAAVLEKAGEHICSPVTQGGRVTKGRDDSVRAIKVPVDLGLCWRNGPYKALNLLWDAGWPPVDAFRDHSVAEQDS